MIADCFFEVQCVRFVDVFDTEVVYHKSEGDGSGFMDEEAGSVGGGEVCGFHKYLFEFFVSEHSELFQTVHGSSDFHVDVAVVGYEIGEIVLVDDLLWDVREFHAHVFVLIEWGIEIHVADVHCHVLGTWSGNDTVDVNFEGFKARGFSADY